MLEVPELKATVGTPYSASRPGSGPAKMHEFWNANIIAKADLVPKNDSTWKHYNTHEHFYTTIRIFQQNAAKWTTH